MEIKKAIITAAGKNQRTLPLQTLVDRDGNAKTALRIIIEEVLASHVSPEYFEYLRYKLTRIAPPC